MTARAVLLAASLLVVLLSARAPRPAQAIPPGASAEADPARTGAPVPPLLPTRPDGRVAPAPRPAASVAASAPDTLRGVASWYATGPAGVAAAGPALRAALGPGWRGTAVLVAAGGRTVRVVLGDWCACAGRLIDLPAAAFARLAQLSRGLLAVTVEPLP